MNTKRSSWMKMLLAASLLVSPLYPVQAQTASGQSTVYVKFGEKGVRPLSLGIGKTAAIELPVDAKDVLIANPEIANAVMRSARRAFIIGGKVGQTSIMFHDANGNQIAAFDVAITRDLHGIKQTLRQILPSADIRVDSVNDAIVLSGIASSPVEAQQAVDLAARMAGGVDNVINSITVKGRDQVNLRVTVAEIQRDVIKQLGIDMSAAFKMGSAVVNLAQANPFAAFGTALNGTGAQANYKGDGGTDLTGVLRAAERAGVVRTLAEPNLTAISGETANFLAGGEFPVPVGQDCTPDTFGRVTCRLSVEFRRFGVSLGFTPVVLSENRISLKVATEVSELSTENALSLAGTGGSSSSVTIPSIKSRRVDTAVEIPSGGSLVLAGMIQEQTKQAINGVPGLANIPVLGTLFRSRDFVNRQTELVIIVTPYTVKAVARRELSQPDENFSYSSDPSAVLFGRLNRIYGTPGKPQEQGAGRQYQGNYGYIID